MDESVTLAQGVASGNNGTLSFWLLPQWHSSTGKASTLKNRRLLEDKVLGCLDMELFHSFLMYEHTWISQHHCALIIGKAVGCILGSTIFSQGI